MSSLLQACRILHLPVKASLCLSSWCLSLPLNAMLLRCLCSALPGLAGLLRLLTQQPRHGKDFRLNLWKMPVR